MEVDIIQANVDEFSKNFSHIKDKKIVLYGTGRRTDRLLSRLIGFNIIGLLDSNESLIGTRKYNLPIISLAEAEKRADCIVINTAEIYWDEIYQEIQDCKIPIYFRDGELAQSKSTPIVISDLVKDRSLTDLEKIVWDIVAERLPFNNSFDNWNDWGFCIWGPVIYVYLNWIYNKAKHDDCKNLLFLSRDGYLLMEDYIYFLHLIKASDFPEPIYVASSRRLTYVAGISSEKDFIRFISDMFSGTFQEFLMIRFGIQGSESDFNCKKRIELPRDIEKVCSWMAPYHDEIRTEIQREKKEYKSYLESLKIDSNYGVIDTGYTGKIVKCLSSLLANGRPHAYYWYGDLRKSNPYKEGLSVCFQKEQDLDASNCNLRKYVFTVETVFTAPHGMIIGIKDEKPQYMEPSSNFTVNELINQGIKQFLESANDKIHYCNDELALYVDKLFGFLMKRTKLCKQLHGELRFSDMWNGVV